MACGGVGGGARGGLPHDGGVRHARPVRARHWRGARLPLTAMRGASDLMFWFWTMSIN